MSLPCPTPENGRRVDGSRNGSRGRDCDLSRAPFMSRKRQRKPSNRSRWHQDNWAIGPSVRPRWRRSEHTSSTTVQRPRWTRHTRRRSRGRRFKTRPRLLSPVLALSWLAEDVFCVLRDEDRLAGVFLTAVNIWHKPHIVPIYLGQREEPERSIGRECFFKLLCADFRHPPGHVAEARDPKAVRTRAPRGLSTQGDFHRPSSSKTSSRTRRFDNCARSVATRGNRENKDAGWHRGTALRARSLLMDRALAGLSHLRHPVLPPMLLGGGQSREIHGAKPRQRRVLEHQRRHGHQAERYGKGGQSPR